MFFEFCDLWYPWFLVMCSITKCTHFLQMCICAQICPTFTHVYLCSNVPHFPDVPNFYKCIFVPQCAQLLPMFPTFIYVFLCPNVTHPQMIPNFTNVYLCHNVPWYGTKYGTLLLMYVTSVTGSNVSNLGMKSAISDIWPIFIELWRHVWRNMSDIFTF